MSHKITIEIESEKEWDAVCALSSILENPLSDIAKNDLIQMTKNTAKRIEEDPALLSALNKTQPENKKRLLAILK